MEELAFRIRPAERGDEAKLRQVIKCTLAHPDGRGRREGYAAAAQRNELLVLERYEPREKTWEIDGFIEWHMRVDDTLTIRDAGSVGDGPHAGVIKHLLNELLRSLNPVEATVKIRRDATAWNELFREVPGFYVEGSEYRRPHWYVVWKYSRELAEKEARRTRRARGRMR